MISAITGELRQIEDDRVHLACGPVIYELLVPVKDVPELRTLSGQPITFHTIFDLEGDATRGGLTPRLIGFLRPEDKRFFELFITVKGIGPKRALRSLEQPTASIAQAIETRNTRFLVQLPEIGKRTAEQIVAELSGKMAEFISTAPGSIPMPAATHSPMEQTAIDGAMALGIPGMEAEHLMDKARVADGNLKSTEALLREMFRQRSGRV